MIQLGKLISSVAGPLVAGAAASEAVSDEHVKLVVTLAGTVVAVVGAVTWLRHEIRGQIKEHAKGDRQRHRAVLVETRHIREILHVRFGLPPPEPLPIELEVTGEIETD